MAWPMPLSKPSTSEWPQWKRLQPVRLKDGNPSVGVYKPKRSLFAKFVLSSFVFTGGDGGNWTCSCRGGPWSGCTTSSHASAHRESRTTRRLWIWSLHKICERKGPRHWANHSGRPRWPSNPEVSLQGLPHQGPTKGEGKPSWQTSHERIKYLLDRHLESDFHVAEKFYSKVATHSQMVMCLVKRSLK